MPTNPVLDRDTLLDAGILLKRVQQLKSNAVDVALAPQGLSMSMWCALQRIAKHPGSSTHELASISCLTDQSFGSLVSKLAERGLVARTQGPGKVILHQLTDVGTQALEAATPVLTDVLAREFGGLTPDELTSFVSFLQRISDAHGVEPERR